MTLKGGPEAWTAGKLGEAAQTHLGQAGHSIPGLGSSGRDTGGRTAGEGGRGHDGGSIGPNFGIIFVGSPVP